MNVKNIVWCHAFILLMHCWILVSGYPSSYKDKYIGDSCMLSDGTEGICKIDNKCPDIIDLIKSNKTYEIVKCGFIYTDQVVCCKSDTVMKINFKKVLCEEDVTEVPDIKFEWEDHILGGVPAIKEEFPHMAAIGYDVLSIIEYNCGGSLIADNFVLTAAHCANKKKALPVVVRLGKISLIDDDMEIGQQIKIEKIILHQDYSSKTSLNDIALLKLDQPAKVAPNIRPACVSSKTQLERKKFTIIGFGVINNKGREKSKLLLKTNVEETPLSECQKIYTEIFHIKPIKKTQICAHNPVTLSDTCVGDSGGPIEYMKNNLHYVYGITSYGHSCGSAYPSIYTRVAEYLDWLENNMNK